MKKNLIFQLLLLITLSLFFHSCVHDELYSSVDPVSKEYTSKSP